MDPIKTRILMTLKIPMGGILRGLYHRISEASDPDKDHPVILLQIAAKPGPNDLVILRKGDFEKMQPGKEKD